MLSLFPLDDAARAEEERQQREAELAERLHWAEHDADFSPPDVPRLGCYALRHVVGLRPASILGPCAGAGAWITAAQETWPEAQVYAVDIRAEERPHLERHVGAEHVRIGDFLTTPPPGPAPELIVDNLPFSDALEFMQRGLDVLAPGGFAAWFVRLTLGDAEEVKAWLAAHPFAWQLDFVDRFKFRVGINPKTGKPWGVDSTGYKLIVFHKAPRWSPVFYGLRLPSLPPASRRWRKTLDGVDIRPGTEYIHGANVEPAPELDKLWHRAT